MAKVLTKLKLCQILRKVFRGDRNVRGADRALEDAEERLKGVHVASVAGIFLPAMVNCAVIIAKLVETAISAPFVSVNGRALHYMGFDFAFQRLAARVSHYFRNHLAVAVLHGKDNCFTGGAAPALSRPSAANITLIGLHVAVERALAVDLAKVLADLVRHAQRRIVSAAQLPLNLFARYAVPRGAEQVHDVVPAVQRGMATMEGSSDHRVNAMAAPLAAISFLSADAIKLTWPLALRMRAFKLFAEAGFHQMLKAGVIIRKLPHEVLERRDREFRCLGHGYALHDQKYSKSGYVRQVDTRVNIFGTYVLLTYGPHKKGNVRVSAPKASEKIYMFCNR
jgi:hypothetical protein